MKIEITDAAVSAVADLREQTFHVRSNYYRDSIRRDLTAALPHLKVTGERKYRVHAAGNRIDGRLVNIVQREVDRWAWTDVCFCESHDEAQAIMHALIAAERGEA